jgi:hypothetical protein
MSIVPVTQTAFRNELNVALADHDPYVWGGTSLTRGCDCSGLIYAAWIAAGGSGLPRDTVDMWNALTHVPVPAYLDLPMFRVPGDGPAADQPAHVGVFISPGVMIQAPHTGLDVEISNIPNIPGVESIMGYVRLPFANAPTPPPPAPPINILELFTMNCIDPSTGGTWVVDPSDGHIECFFGAPYLGGLNAPANRYGWQQVGYIAGITSWTDPNGQEGYAVIVRHNVVQANGAFYSTYTFERNGSNVAAMGGHEVALIG